MELATYLHYCFSCGPPSETSGLVTTWFSEAFLTLNRGYETVSRYTRSANIFDFLLVLFPLLQTSHWFLSVFDFENKELYILDPYVEEKNENFVVSEHMKELDKLERDYLLIHFTKTYPQEPWTPLKKFVKIPPLIPQQEDGWNCGVFLLQFSLCLATQKEFSFQNGDMSTFRCRIKQELLEGKLFINENTTTSNTAVSEKSKLKHETHKRRIADNDECCPKKSRQGKQAKLPGITRKSTRTLKRQSDETHEYISKKMIKHNEQTLYDRRFLNKDAETCWVNSALQCFINGLDYLNEVTFDSSLGLELIKYQKQKLIDAFPFKLLLQQLINENPNTTHRMNIVSGQQCARDFLIILSENPEFVADVFHCFKHTVMQITSCTKCGIENVHVQTHLYDEILCPEDNTLLSDELKKKYNESETIENFNCEDGCNIRTSFKKNTKIVAGQSSEFLIIVLSRVIYDTFNNYYNKVQVTDSFKTYDSSGICLEYEPIAVIEKRDGLIAVGDSSTGHYICDVKEKTTGLWLRTDDDKPIRKLSFSEVSKSGFIVMYKRKHSNTTDVT